MSLRPLKDSVGEQTLVDISNSGNEMGSCAGIENYLESLNIATKN